MASSIRYCIVAGCSYHVVCVDVYDGDRRQPVHAVGRTLCATHAISESYWLLADCDSCKVHGELQELAQADMDSAIAANLRSRGE